MSNRILKKCLGLDGAVVEGARIEGESIIVSARPRKAAPRCPVCGRRCRPYDRLKARRWRAQRIGVDETSYKKRHKYMTVVVDHDRGRVV